MKLNLENKELIEENKQLKVQISLIESRCESELAFENEVVNLIGECNSYSGN